MIIGILALAMLVGGGAAVAALVSGYSFLIALTIYSGVGSLAALAAGSAVAVAGMTRNNAVASDVPPDAVA